MVAVSLFIRPSAHRVEHVSLDFNIFLANCRMMKYSKDVRHNFVDRDAWVLPCIDDSPVGIC